MSVTGLPETAQVRVIHASPDAGTLDSYQDDNALAYGLELGTITSYVPAMAGTSTLSMHAANTGQRLALLHGVLAREAHYTLVVGDTLAGLHPMLLRDADRPAPAGETAVRVVDEATGAGGLDLYLLPSGLPTTQARLLRAGVLSLHASSYQDLSAGVYTLEVVRAGSGPQAKALYAGPALNYEAGSAHTLVLMDGGGEGSRLEVLVAPDYDPTTAN